MFTILSIPPQGFFVSLLRLFFSAKEERTLNNDVLSDKFTVILKDYLDMISRICFGFAKNFEEMEDFRQDTLLNIWQSLNTFRGESSIKTWIYRITINTCISSLRKGRPDTDSFIPEIADSDYERRLQIMELHDMISQLAPIERAILLLWLEEFNYEEISNITGIPRNTVATKIRRAKLKLSKMG